MLSCSGNIWELGRAASMVSAAQARASFSGELPTPGRMSSKTSVKAF